MVIDALVNQRAAVGIQAFERIARPGAVGIVRRLMMHDFGAVRGQLGHLFERRALDGARALDALGIGRHRAAHVGVDIDPLGVERVPDGDSREIGSSAPQRGDGTVFANALKAGDDRDDIALENFANRPRLDAQNLCVAVVCIGDNAGLRAGQRDRRDARLRELVGKDGRGDLLARGEQQVGVSAVRLGRAAQCEEAVGGVRFGCAPHRRNNGDDGKTAVARVAHAAVRKLAPLAAWRPRFRRTSERRFEP